MGNDIDALITIAIPTYNRSFFLKRLLYSIIPQVIELKDGKVEICISDNASIDNTGEIVDEFKEEYPNLIRYRRNRDNLGFDRNLLRVIDMARGKFIWLFGDDNQMGEGGLARVVKFIKEHDESVVGMIVGGRESWFVDDQTVEKILYDVTVDETKAEVYELNKEEIVGAQFADGAFISVQIFNGDFLKRVVSRDYNIVKEGIGTGYIHMLLYRLMFLEYGQLKGFMLNKMLVLEQMPHYRVTIEDEFKLSYGASKLEDLLLSFSKPELGYNNLFYARKLSIKGGFLIKLGLMRAFDVFNYSSYYGCIKLFFCHSSLSYGLLLSVVFTLLSTIPTPILRNLYRIFLKLKYGNSWNHHWEGASVTYSKMFNGTRRRVF